MADTKNLEARIEALKKEIALAEESLGRLRTYAQSLMVELYNAKKAQES